MARDKELLTDKEFFSKTCHIVEQVRDCKINLSYYDEHNLVKEEVSLREAKQGIGTGKQEFRLNVATPAVKGIEKFTAFNHEAGHILGETPIAEAREVIESWTHADEEQRRKQGMNIYKAKDGAMREKTYWDMFNIIEDQRVEDMMTNIWLANKKRFTKARRNRGKMHVKCADNPIDVMLNIRFFREDLVKRKKNWKEYKQALEDVVGTGRMGGILILTRIKPLIDKFYDDKEKETKRLINLSKIAKTPETKAKHEKSVLKQAKNEHEKVIDGNDHNGLNKYETKPNKDGSKFNPNQLPKEHEKEKLEKLIAGEKEKGKEEIKNVRRLMSGNGSDGGLGAVAVPSYVTRVERKQARVEVDNEISSGLKKVFRKISEMPKEKIGYDGDEIDMDAYLEGKIRGYDISNCFIDKKMTQGASVVITIDGSGSMKGYNIDQVRNLVATLYDSIKGLPNIEMKANVWSSNGKGNCGITDINSKEDCHYINVMDKGYYFTPTHLALDYSARQLKHMKGRRKLLIMITDGVPQYQNNNFNMKRDTLLKMTRKAVLRVLRSTPHMMVIHVGRNGYIRGLGMHTDEYLGKIFGKKRMMRVPYIDSARDEVVNQFKNVVVRTLK